MREAGHVLQELGLAARLLHPAAVGDVTGETARVHEPAVLPEGVGRDQDVLDRAVPGAHLRLPGVHRLAATEPRQDLGDRLGVDVELGDVMPDVFLAPVAEKIQLGLVGAQDGAVGPDPVQAHGGVLEELGLGVLEELGQRALAAEQRRLGAGAPGDVQRHAQRTDDAVAAGAPRLDVDLVDTALVPQLVHRGHAREGGPVRGQRRIVGVARAKVIAEQEADDLVGAQPQRGEAGAARVQEAELAIGRPHDRGQLLEQQPEVDLLHRIHHWNYTIGPAGREDGKCFSLFRYPGIAAPRRGLVRSRRSGGRRR